MNRRAETLVLGALCATCLIVPAVAILSGALDEPEAGVGGGAVVYTRNAGALEVRSVYGRKPLPVSIKEVGADVVEKDAAVIPTQKVDSRAHHDASPIELRARERQRRGGPVIQPAE